MSQYISSLVAGRKSRHVFIGHSFHIFWFWFFLYSNSQGTLLKKIPFDMRHFLQMFPIKYSRSVLPCMLRVRYMYFAWVFLFLFYFLKNNKNWFLTKFPERRKIFDYNKDTVSIKIMSVVLGRKEKRQDDSLEIFGQCIPWSKSKSSVIQPFNKCFYFAFQLRNQQVRVIKINDTICDILHT